MSCTKCNRKNRNNEVKTNAQVTKVLQNLKKGLCKISIKRVNENKVTDVYCTLQSEFLPSKDSHLFRKSPTIKEVNNTGMVLVWTTDINLNVGMNKKSGWIKLPIESIRSYQFIESIPVI
tara:strand:- start:65 stop:424 length:360 start_codon:yes stop_codon:yes gene_type:complete